MPFRSRKRQRLYQIWRDMNRRCYNPKRQDYRWYGGRGVTVCENWRSSFHAFRRWAVAHGYESTLTLDRIDNDKGYGPSNCRWATRQVQSQNRRGMKINEVQVRLIRSFHRQGRSVKSLAKKFGVHLSMVYSIVRRKSWAHIQD